MKVKEAEFREVTMDAQNSLEDFGGDEEKSGWNPERQRPWKVRETLDSFAGHPVEVVELKEFYLTREKDRSVGCWIVTTDLDLPLEEVREAAHQVWQIENGHPQACQTPLGHQAVLLQKPPTTPQPPPSVCATVVVLD